MGTGTAEIRVQWHRVMTAVLAVEPSLHTLEHWSKSVSGGAVRTTDNWSGWF